MKRILIFLLLVVQVGMVQVSVAQQDAAIQKIITLGQNDNQAMNHLDILCNRFGGRLIGSAAYTDAAEWAASKFREWGMQVIMDEAGSVPVGFNRGPWFGKLLGENGMDLHFCTPSYTSGTKGLQQGPVVLEPKTTAELNRMKGTLKGAWVLISGKSDGWNIDFSKRADYRRAKIMAKNDSIGRINDSINMINRISRDAGAKKELIPVVEEPALFYRQMVDAGILGIIQSAPVPIRVLYDRKNLDSLTFDNLPAIPDIKLDENQYAVIERMAKERRNFQLEFDIRNHFKPGPVKYYSVIGVIPGTEFPDEYVIMSGHLDCFDVATGGVDDGSGASPTMEAARLIMKAGAKPKRTILACLWAAEEYGLWGSTAWIKHNEDKLPKISNMFNRDGGPLAPVNLSVPDAMWEDMSKVCAPLNSINPDFPFTLKKMVPREIPKRAGGTDSSPFAMRGVPTMTFGLEDTKGYNFDYQEIWHTERDLYNKSIPEYQKHAAVVTAVTVFGVANLDHLLSRKGYFLLDKPATPAPAKETKQGKKR